MTDYGDRTIALEVEHPGEWVQLQSPNGWGIAVLYPPGRYLLHNVIGVRITKDPRPPHPADEMRARMLQ